MNCIQPIAPAELGPMFCPKFDSTLLIAANTCHGTPYAAPALCHSWESAEIGNCSGFAGGVVNDTGTEIEPGAFGDDALGSAIEAPADDGADDTVKPIGPAARAEPATSANPIAAAARVRLI
jgi:hypothetical protein